MRAAREALTIATCLLAACAHPADTPEEAASAWVAATRAGDARAVEALSTTVVPTPAALDAARTAVGDAVLGPATRIFEIRGDGDERTAQADAADVRIVLGPEGPRIATPLVAPLSGATAEGAALAFLRAIEAKRPELLLTVMPAAIAAGGEAAARAAIASEAVDELRGAPAEALRAALPARRTGEDAAAVAGGGWVLRLVREAGGWKVDDVHREEPWR